MRGNRCLRCGMQLGGEFRQCPKCDQDLMTQSDGSTVTVDIAHHGERVQDALRKLDYQIQGGRRGVAARLRIIVGSGVIRDAVLAELGTYQHRGDVVDFDFDTDNPGAITVRLV